jgi:hypothetical protein
MCAVGLLLRGAWGFEKVGLPFFTCIKKIKTATKVLLPNSLVNFQF